MNKFRLTCSQLSEFSLTFGHMYAYPWKMFVKEKSSVTIKIKINGFWAQKQQIKMANIVSITTTQTHFFHIYNFLNVPALLQYTHPVFCIFANSSSFFTPRKLSFHNTGLYLSLSQKVFYFFTLPIVIQKTKGLYSKIYDY